VLTEYTNCDMLVGMTRKKPPTDLDEQLRAAFVESGLSRFAWANKAGVPYAAVFHFAGGDRTVTLRTASKLCDVLGLELRAKRDGK
jgi:plasmid maintenance system antidote protein VapI